MSSKAKALKLSGILTLGMGMSLVIAGIAMMVVTQFSLESMLLFVAGGFCLFLGREAALVANVPSTAHEVIFSSGSAVFWTVCLAVGAWFAAGRQLNLCVELIPVSTVMCGLVTAMLVVVAKDQEKV